MAFLKRFVSRGEKAKEIVSDCSKNFVGESKKFKDIYKILTFSQHNEEEQST